MKKALQLGAAVLVAATILTAQPSQALVVGTAVLQHPLDLAPYPLLVAPGQVLTLLVGGLNTDGMATVSARSGAVLPFQLGGVSASIVQGSRSEPKPVPLIEIRVLSGCPWNRAAIGGACATALTALTVQMPYDLQPQFGLDFKEVPAQLSIEQGGRAGAWVDVRVLTTQAHFGVQCEGHLTAPSVPWGLR